MKKRSSLHIGMPRVLNMYLYAPLFSAYLESLGIEPENLVYSEFTGQDMYRAGAGRSSDISSEARIRSRFRLFCLYPIFDRKFLGERVDEADTFERATRAEIFAKYHRDLIEFGDCPQLRIIVRKLMVTHAASRFQHNGSR